MTSRLLLATGLAALLAGCATTRAIPDADTKAWSQPMDFEAAGKFNLFFYNLVEAVADGEARPAFTPASPYRGNSH
jgi:hypothetical protein